MPSKIESHGDIETVCTTDDLGPNKMAKLIFRAWDDAVAPFQVRVYAPNGKLLLERVLRALPTGLPQSPPPVSFTVRRGEYSILIREMHGKAEGTASLDVS